ncbi:MAG: hypothetical protein L0209_12895, partial [candidate division Zixibacteria bacterium]|nr:hypothetical protein [candidate division Zixibacteria bacterium]
PPARSPLRVLPLCLAFLLAGCATFRGTLEFCDKTTYERQGNRIHIEADCRVPLEDGRTTFTPAEMLAALLAMMMAM